MNEWYPEAGDPGMYGGERKEPDPLPAELTHWVGGPPTSRADKIDWREGWWWYGALNVDWYDWGFGLHVGYKHKKNIGGDFQFGPFYGYGAFEYGLEGFEDGKRCGMGIGRV